MNQRDTLPDQGGSLPALIGICPVEHTRDFYVPIGSGDSLICPECDKPMALYSPCAARFVITGSDASDERQQTR